MAQGRFYGVRKEDGLIDYDQVERLAQEHQPKLIIAGGSAYPRQIDFARFRRIADSVNAYLMVDMGALLPVWSPGAATPTRWEYADVVTTTTHKTLRGPRGGMILTNNEELAKKSIRQFSPAPRAARWNILLPPKLFVSKRI